MDAQNSTNFSLQFVPHNFTSLPDNFLNDSESVNVTRQFNSSRQNNLSRYYPYLAAELSLSIFCSVFLIFVYVLIGEHRSIPGKNVICISFCLIVSYILFMVDLMFRGQIPQDICYGMAVATQATFLAVFFWTNVMSYDIMQTMASVKQNSKVASHKFLKYSVYAWSMTAACVVPAVAIDFMDSVPEMYRPKFGRKKCWLTGQLAFLIYLNTPVGVTLLFNCIFFVLTARIIVKVRNETAILAANRHRKRFRLCMKLVMIMGLVWIAEFIPWLTGIYWLYAIAGMLNCLHGLYLFIIFACKRRTLKEAATKLLFLCSSPAKPTPKQKQSPSIDTITTIVSS